MEMYTVPTHFSVTSIPIRGRDFGRLAGYSGGEKTSW